MLRWSLISPAPDTGLYVSVGDQGICEISFAATAPGPSGSRADDDPLISEAARQLALYFDGRLRNFDLPLDMRGTAFQKRVWDALRQIPYGETRSYAELAAMVESPQGFRAVGAANGRNPIPIIVPCHRVIESNGGLGGFSCGIAYKRRLLDLESRYKLNARSQQ
jgi:methylated-DNA-[protein]-cysteine S-methyltransferase